MDWIGAQADAEIGVEARAEAEAGDESHLEFNTMRCGGLALTLALASAKA